MTVPRWMVGDAQQTLFEEDKFIYKPIFGGGATNVIIGQFFEQVAARMLNTTVQVPVSTKWDTYPDLVKYGYNGHDLLFEVKSSHSNPLITMNQMEALQEMAAQPFPFTEAKVYYVLYFYTVHHHHLNFSRYHDLLGALAKDIVVCYILPLDIMQQLTKNLTPMAASWQNKLVRWKLSVDKLFRAAKEDSFLEAFERLTGDNGTNYLALNNYSLSSFYTNGIKVSEYKVKKFPVIMVNDVGEDFEIHKEL